MDMKTAQGPDTAAEAGVDLPADVRALLTELARALHRQAMYPPEHPALRGSSVALAQLVNEVLDDSPEIAIHVGRNQLAVEGALSDPSNPALAPLANQLHRHHVASLALSREIGPDEVSELLAALSADPDQDAASPLSEKAWRHVRITFLQYDRLTLDERGSLPAGELGDVWLALAHSALGDDGVDPAEATDASRLARDIEARCTDDAYARSVMQNLLEVERAIEQSPGETSELRELASNLVSSLDPAALRSLLDRGTTTDERRQLLAGASNSLQAGALVKLLREVAELDDCEIPHSVWMMLTKLARYAEQGLPDRRSHASEVVRKQVLELLANWDISSSTPSDYANVLEAMSADRPAETAHGAGSSRTSVEAARVLQMGIEVERVEGPALDGFSEMVREGAIAELLDVLEEAPAENPAVPELRAQLERPEILASLLDQAPLDSDVIDRLIARLGVAAAPPLLDALAGSESRAVRSQLLRRLDDLGPGIGPEVIQRLDDERWFVRRNLLSLLEGLGGSPEGFTAAPHLEDENEGVRLAAIKLLLREPPERARAVAAALQCDDSRTVILGLLAARGDPPEDQVGRIVVLALTKENSREVRVHAIRALEEVRSDVALEALLQIARGKRRWTLGRRVAGRSVVTREALAVLRSTWGDEARAKRVLRHAGHSKGTGTREAR
jgi:hypothetical protein